MGVIDWIILLGLLIAMFMGWRKGLVATIINLAAVIVGFFLIGHFYPLVANSLQNKFSLSASLSTIISVILILVLLTVLVRVVIAIFHRILKGLKLSGVNRLFGMLLGLINGLLIVFCVMIVFDYFPRFSQSLKDPSRHRVYAGVHLLKDETFSTLKLSQQVEYLKLRGAELNPINQNKDTDK